MLDPSNDVNTFQVENNFFCKIWTKLTKDPCILELDSNGLQLDLKYIILQQGSGSHPLSVKETKIISLEIQCQKKKNNIYPC